MRFSLQLLPLLLLAAIGYGTGQDAIPHVDDCSFCFDCAVGDKPPAGGIPRHGQPRDKGVDGGLGSEYAGVRRRLGRALLSDSAISGGIGSSSGSSSGGDSGRTSRRGPLAGGAPWGGGELPSSSSSSRLGGAARSLLQGLGDDAPDPVHGLRPSMFTSAGADRGVLKSSLPNCTRCWGCSTQLGDLAPESTFLDRVFANEKGATSSWIFRATTNRTASGLAVLKIYCMPLPKRPGAKIPTCAPQTIMRNMHLLLGLQRLSNECGFEDIVPRVWVDRVSAIIPGLGYHVRWYGLWMEIAEGISMENFLHRGQPTRLAPPTIIDTLQNKLNKTQVLRAAIFDLLTSQCDRHAQNIFITERGQLWLIDNEAALQSNWKNCAVDSILVPGTQKFTIVRLSNQFVVKLVAADAAPKGLADPQVLMDYRCYIDTPELGTAYPPRIRQCLADVAALSVQQVQQRYGFSEELPAFNLQARASDMLNKGFEWAFKFGKPLNADPKRYRVPPKCCRIEHAGHAYRCAHAWEPVFEVPVGDPFTGREWTKPRADTGTYQGGTYER